MVNADKQPRDNGQYTEWVHGAPQVGLYAPFEPGTTSGFRRLADELPTHHLWHKDPERLCRIGIAGLIEPGNAVVGRLIDELGAEGALNEILNGTRDDIEELHQVRIEALRAGDADLRAVRDTVKLNLNVTTPDDDHYPAGFTGLGDRKPYALFVRGDASLLAGDCQEFVALAGSRAPTAYGEHVTMEFAAGLVDHGKKIVTGSSFGIENMAVRTTVASGGKNVVILSTGLGRELPVERAKLLEQVEATGVIVSELPPQATISKMGMLQANRLRAAIAGTTLVVEAGFRSDCLNTASQAFALGRRLAVVPGPITSAGSQGIVRLLREFNAEAVGNVDHLLEIPHTAAEKFNAAADSEND
jgi:DNA processing protein